MAAGKAIVSTSIGAEGIPCRHGADIWIADTAASFAEATITLLKDNELREQTGRKAAELAGLAFNNNSLVAELVKFYRSLT